MLKWLLGIYIITLSMTHSFALLPVLPIPLIIAFLLLFVILFKVMIDEKKIKMPLLGEDLILVLLIFGIGFSSLANGIDNVKHLNHFMAFIVVFVFYYFGVRIALCNTNFYRKDILFFILIGVVFASSFGVAEFVSKNFTGFNIENYIFRPSVQEYNPTYLGCLIRSRSFVEESGHYALYLNAFLPLIVYYLRAYVRNKQLTMIVLLLVLASYVFTFSAAGIFAILLSCAVVGFISILIALNERRDLFVVLRILLIPVVCFLFMLLTFNVWEPIIDKLLFINAGEGFDRLVRWNLALSEWVNAPIIGKGVGFASVEYGTGIVNFYLKLLLESGLLSLLIFVVFLMLVFKRILRINSKIRYVYLVSFVAVSIHYGAVSNFWYPWLWFLIVLIQLDYCYFNQKEKH